MLYMPYSPMNVYFHFEKACVNWPYGLIAWEKKTSKCSTDKIQVGTDFHVEFCSL